LKGLRDPFTGEDSNDEGDNLNAAAAAGVGDADVFIPGLRGGVSEERWMGERDTVPPEVKP